MSPGDAYSRRWSLHLNSEGLDRKSSRHCPLAVTSTLRRFLLLDLLEDRAPWAEGREDVLLRERKCSLVQIKFY